MVAHTLLPRTPLRARARLRSTAFCLILSASFIAACLWHGASAQAQFPPQRPDLYDSPTGRASVRPDTWSSEREQARRPRRDDGNFDTDADDRPGVRRASFTDSPSRYDDGGPAARRYEGRQQRYDGQRYDGQQRYDGPRRPDGSQRFEGQQQRYDNQQPRFEGPPSGQQELPSPQFETGGEFQDGGYDEGYYDDDGGPYFDDGGYEDQLPYGNMGLSCRRLWVRGEYLLWGMKGFDTPPLVTSSPAGTDRTQAGILGLPNTVVLFGGDNLGDKVLSGGRVTVGYWIDPCETAGLEASYFGFGTSSTNFNAVGTDVPILARPFTNLDPISAGNDAELVAFPNQFSGSIAVSATSQLQGVDVLFRHGLCRDCLYRIDFLAGWRYLQLNDTLLISDEKTALSGNTGLAIGTTLTEFDSFNTRNTFNGAELGFATEMTHCRWSLESRLTVAIGANQSTTTINGQATSTTPVTGGAPQVVTTPAGLLAQQTNIGTHTVNNLAVVPQLGLNLGYDINCHLRAIVGYSFMYWSQVLRPGDQIDTDVNLSQLSPDGLVGAARPKFPGVGTDFWAQGLNIGLDYRF